MTKTTVTTKYHWQLFGTFGNITTKTKIKSLYCEENFFLQTPSKPGVLVGKTFSHTPDEARSVGLAKACVS